MAYPIKQNDTAAELVFGPAVDITNAFTPETGLLASTVDILGIYKPGATVVTTIATTEAFESVAHGYYRVTLASTAVDTVGRAKVVCRDDSVCLPFWQDIVVLDPDAYDALYATATTTGNLSFLDAAISSTAGAVYEESLEDHDTEGTAGYSVLLSVYAGSMGPGIYIDSDAANTNTVKGTDGTEANPVSTFTAARTLADGIGTDTYYLETGTDLTLAATHVNWRFFGLGSPTDTIINLGSQDVSMSLFDHVTLEGTQGGSSRIIAEDCELRDPGPGSTTLHILGLRCGIIDDITLDTSNDNVLVDSYSLVAGGGAPIVRASGSAGTLIMNGHKGGVDLRDLSASHNLTVNIAGGQVIFDASCNVNANVELRGIGTKTDNTAGMADLNEIAFLNLDAITDSVWDEPLSGHVTGGTAGKALRDVRDTNVSVDGSVNDGAPAATGFITNLTATADDFYKDQPVTFTDGALAKQTKNASTYNGTTKAFTFSEPFTSAPANGDNLVVGAMHVHPIDDVALEVWTSLTSLSTATTTFGGVLDAAVSSRATSNASDIWDLATRTLTAATIVWADTGVEATGAPSATPTRAQQFDWIYTLSRNKITQTATILTLRDDADGVDISTASVSDDGSTFTRAEWL